MSPEEILLTSIAPLQRSVASYGDAQLALAAHQRARSEQLADAEARHQQALAILGLQQKNALALQAEREKAQDARYRDYTDRALSLVNERELNADVDETEGRNRSRDSLYETAAAYGFKIDPKLEPEENQRKAAKVIEDRAVEGYKNLIGERTKIKDEIDDLLTPIKVSDREVYKALVTDPMVAGVLDKNQVAALQAGKFEEATKRLDKKEKALVMEQAQTVREKLEAVANTEHQRKAMVKARELTNRYDELGQAIGAAQKAIPAHRLGDAYFSSDKKEAKPKAGGKEAFAAELQQLLGGGTPKLSAAQQPTMPPITPDMIMAPPIMSGGNLVAPLRGPAMPVPRNFGSNPVTPDEQDRINAILGLPTMKVLPQMPGSLLTNPSMLPAQAIDPAMSLPW